MYTEEKRLQERERRSGGQQESRQQERGKRNREQWDDDRLKTGLQARELQKAEQWEKEQEERRERERQQRRRRRIEEMKREKHRREMLFRYGVPGAAVAAVLCVILLIAGIGSAARQGDHSGNGRIENTGGISARGGVSDSAENRQMSPMVVREALSAALQQTYAEILSGAVIQRDMASAIGLALLDTPPVFEAHATEYTNGFGDTILSSHGIMIDVEKGEVLAQKDGWSRINPASMTKILTILVAAEHITDVEDTFTMI